MKFSIIIPVYNAEKYVEDCIKSVLCQKFLDYEIILVDDGSTDKSNIICDSFASEKVKVIHKSNGGQISARSEGYRNSSGEYILFLDADDTITYNMLETLNGYINEFNADCIIFEYEKVCNDVIIYSSKAKFPQAALISDKSKLMGIVLSDSGYNPLWRKAIKREFACSNDFAGFYKLRHGEDLVQSLKIYENANSFLFIPDVLYKYRLNDNSVTNSIEKHNYSFDFLISREEIFKCIERLNCFDDKQLQDFRGICVKMLINEIVVVARFNCSFKDKVTILKRIKQTDYYKERINKHKYNRSIVGKRIILYHLFKLNMYRLLLFLIKVKNRLIDF